MPFTLSYPIFIGLILFISGMFSYCGATFKSLFFGAGALFILNVFGIQDLCGTFQRMVSSQKLMLVAALIWGVFFLCVILFLLSYGIPSAIKVDINGFSM